MHVDSFANCSHTAEGLLAFKDTHNTVKLICKVQKAVEIKATHGEFEAIGTAVGDVILRKIWNGQVSLTKQLCDGLETITDLTFSPDGTRLAARDQLGTIHLWEIASNVKDSREIQVFNDKEENVNGLGFSAGGKLLVSLGEKVARVWDLSSDKNVDVPVIK